MLEDYVEKLNLVWLHSIGVCWSADEFFSRPSYTSYKNVTWVGYWNNNLNGFILHDIQGCFKRGILIASLVRKTGPARATPSMLIFRKISPFSTKGYYLVSSTLHPTRDYFPRNLILFILVSRLKNSTCFLFFYWTWDSHFDWDVKNV